MDKQQLELLVQQGRDGQSELEALGVIINNVPTKLRESEKPVPPIPVADNPRSIKTIHKTKEGPGMLVRGWNNVDPEILYDGISDAIQRFCEEGGLSYTPQKYGGLARYTGEIHDPNQLSLAIGYKKDAAGNVIDQTSTQDGKTLVAKVQTIQLPTETRQAQSPTMDFRHNLGITDIQKFLIYFYSFNKDKPTRERLSLAQRDSFYDYCERTGIIRH